MKIHSFSLATLLASSVLLTDAIAQTTATTDPVGFVTVNITAGTGTAKRNTLFSVPLLGTEAISGQVTGVITGVTANTISNDNAGWTPGALSQPAAPYLIQITSGAAQGRIFLISSSAPSAGSIGNVPNTATTATISPIDATQVNLTTLGILAGTDTYKIYPCDTLGSFFGTPASSGVLGGSAVNTADTVFIVLNGSVNTYWYNTAVTPNRWSRSGPGNVNSSNVALLPNYGIQYSRLGNTALSFTITGQVPDLPRKVSINNSGTTLLSQYWPIASTLFSIGLQALPNWTTGNNAATADTVILTSNGTPNTYFYNGSNWRRVGPGSANFNDTEIPIGSSIQIGQKGAEAGYTTLNQQVPYSL